MPATRMSLPGIRPLTGQQQQSVNRGQSALQATRPRVTLPGAGGFGAKTQQAPVAKTVPTPTPGKGSAPGMPMPAQQPMFNLPNPMQAPPAVSSTTMSLPIGYQNPIGQYQTPAPAQNPPIAGGNFGTIQSGPYPISGVAMPTPNPVPPAPAPNLPGPQQIDAGTGSPPVMGGGMMGGGMMTPGSMGDQVAQQQSGMNALPGFGGMNFGAMQDPNAPPLDQYGNPVVAPGDVAGSWAQGFR
jgi:hypothetical protein